MIPTTSSSFFSNGFPLEILPLVPTLQEHMILAEAMDHVKEFGAAFHMLQKNDHYNLSEVRVMFDSLIEIVPALSPYLRKNADTVQILTSKMVLLKCRMETKMNFPLKRNRPLETSRSF